MSVRKIIDFTGQQFGKWTVLGLNEERSKRRAVWICRCICGTIRSVDARNLRAGASKGCKCSNLRDRFLKHVRIEPNGCWFWLGAKKRKGYGFIRINNRQGYTHRFAYETFMGPIPEGQVICHKCDNPSCVNPLHLFCGTMAEDMADCVAKERQMMIDSGGKARIWSRNYLPLEPKFPTIGAAVNQLSLRSTILDGEIVALDDRGIPTHFAP
jgi:hypothetical protein